MDAEGDRLYVEGLEFHAYHGVSAEEQRVGHRFVADVSLWLDLRPAGEADDLRLTVDYAEVAAIVAEEGRRGPYRLMEALAERIAGRLLEATACRCVRVRVAKANPPIPSHAARAGVEIERRRAEPRHRS